MCFSVADEIVHLHTKDGKVYPLHYSLDYVESMEDPNAFFRANRQYVVSYHAIKEIQHYYDRKLLIELRHPNAEPVVVSKAKASAFIQWMENH
jgi:DNA-binding LytR/AlgR family response regulator